MDILSQSIRKLESLLLPNIIQQEDKQLRAEIAVLKEERKKLEAVEAELRAGVSFYGSYFTTSQWQCKTYQGRGLQRVEPYHQA